MYSCADDATTITSSEATNENAQIEYRGASGNCFSAASAGCQSTLYFVEETQQFETDAGCLFEATWITTFCYLFNGQNEEFNVVITDFEATPIEDGCEDLLNLWNYYAATDQDDALLTSMQDFENAASVIVEEYTMNFVIPGIWQIDCAAPQAQLTAELYRSTCNQLYKYRVEKGRLYYYEFESTSCGNVCCVRETQYCFDNGSLVTLGTCFDDTNFGSPGIGYIAVGGCETNCEK